MRLSSENGEACSSKSAVITSNQCSDTCLRALRPPRMVGTMSKIDSPKAQIERLPSEEFAEICRWLSEKDWERWDKETAADSDATDKSTAGKTGFGLRGKFGFFL